MHVPAPLAALGPAERAALKRRLDRLYRTFDRSYLETDPLAFVHRYQDDADREIVAFISAGLAFGNVRAIQASLSNVLAPLGSSPSTFIDGFEPDRDGGSMGGLYHRWIRAEDIVKLVQILGRMRTRSGSIGGFFLEGYRATDDDIGASLASFCERALALSASGPTKGSAGGSFPAPGEGSRARSLSAPRESPAARNFQAPGEGSAARNFQAPRDGSVARNFQAPREGSAARFFPSPRSGSACKRLNLFLRWMVRDGDGLDLGLWKSVSRRQLVLPLDTHLVRLTRALGLTARRSPGWAMAVEATRSLALLDPDDPVKYDFSLSRLGILDLCLHGRDPLECRTCVRPRIVVRRKSNG